MTALGMALLLGADVAVAGSAGAVLVTSWDRISSAVTRLRLRVWYQRARRDVPGRPSDGCGRGLTFAEWRQLADIQTASNSTDIPEPVYDRSDREHS